MVGMINRPAKATELAAIDHRMQRHKVFLYSGAMALIAIIGWRVGGAFAMPPGIIATPASTRVDDRTPSVATTPALMAAPPAQKSVSELMQEMAAAFRSARPEERDFALGTLLPALMAQNPEAAARAVLDITDEDLRHAALDHVGRLWAARDPQTALRWADALPFRDERETALTGACRQLAAESVPRAVKTLAAYLPGDRPLGDLEDLALRWAGADLETARAWTLALVPGPRREGLVARLAYVQSKTEPAAAAAIVTELPPGDARDESVISVLHQWALRDRPGALAWVERFPESTLRERAIAELNSIAQFQLATTAR